MLRHSYPFDDSLHAVTSGAVFLMGAIALILPSGYSVGSVLLLLASPLLLFNSCNYSLSRRDYWIIAALALYGLVVGFMSVLELGSRGFDRPVRFLLAIPVLLLILRFPPRQSWLWLGLMLGAMGAGSFAAWLKFVEGDIRPGGFLHPIQFGNLSLLMGVLCLAGSGWAMTQRHRYSLVALLLAGALMGMFGSLLSGSRGGWIGLPLIFYVLYRGYGRQLPIAVKIGSISAMIVLVMSMYALPQTGVQERVNAAVSDIGLYISGEELDTSLGLRFEMWRGASQLILERPLLGWGESGYEAAMANLGEQGEISLVASEFGHAHNEFIDAFAKRGLVGVAILLVLYMVPIRMFASGLMHADLNIRALAVAGTLLPVTFIDFGLSQAFLSHNSGVMFYAFWLAVFWGSYSASLRQFQPEGCDPTGP